MKNILVSGSNGQLGSELRELCNFYDSFNFYFTDIEDLDISDKHQLDFYVKSNKIDYFINCAAYTAVDKAETDITNAFSINADSLKYISEVCIANKVFLIHISTDYVFDGSKNTPYNEEDAVCPISEYGKSKLQGEEYVKASGVKALIIRTSWLYSSYGHNFVKTILKLSKERDSLTVVFDQTGSLTYAKDLAIAILDLINDNKLEAVSFDIVNYSNEGVSSWYDVAFEIANLSGSKCIINPIETHEYPNAVAKRPTYSVLNKRKIKNNYGIIIPHWSVSLKACLDKLLGLY
ncbi:MAG: dTDP-4-dehydrorhamnose reductase [Bacteroidetes bacterium GWE2_29_8]|nr:MAG: dTDP-4-dehydrorhamnose reductase [Bacteroidetes bacterium GWE2_29_8]OFY14418.1 MAG: dTDP-4-dehydrorhamnose reductase [Bacteroidetes bacterium GWF2_29_10]